MQFYAHVICDVETKISGRRRKRDFTATEMAVGLETEKDLENERTRRASVLSLLSSSLFSSIQVWMSETGFQRKMLQIECSLEEQKLGAEYHPQNTESQ